MDNLLVFTCGLPFPRGFCSSLAMNWQIEGPDPITSLTETQIEQFILLYEKEFGVCLSLTMQETLPHASLGCSDSSEEIELRQSSSGNETSSSRNRVLMWSLQARNRFKKF